MAHFTPISKSAASSIASLTPNESTNLEAEISQVEHRIEMINFWQIPAGSRVLEIGSGQGTCTVALAEAVGATGHVDALDPGAPDYGSPITLGQAQTHISGTAIGRRISWHRAKTVAFLQENKQMNWDYVVMAHCIWYYSSLEDLSQMLTALKGRATFFLVSEWALKASELTAVPHLLAAIARGSLEAHRTDTQPNICCMSSPSDIKDTAKLAGWTLQEEKTVVPNSGVLDGHWEFIMVRDKQFNEDVDKYIKEERVRVMLRSSREAVLASLAVAGVKKSRSMDVWFARFN